MNLSISNIAWTSDYDVQMYAFLKEIGYNGLEIAPTRLFIDHPYTHIEEAKEYAEQLRDKYELVIPSMQSIWYGRQEKIFGDEKDRKTLIEYTRKACEFANAIGCKNLVFGNPRNRETTNLLKDYPIAIDFFHTLGEIALENNTIVAIEPNPTIYNTHFVNFTNQAVELADRANSRGIKVNFDLGAAIENNEDVNDIYKIGEYVNHLHISEPFLNPISRQHEELHRVLIDFAKSHKDVFLSIEMGNKVELEEVKIIMKYVKGLVA